MINDSANNLFPIAFNSLRQFVLLGIAVISSLSPLSQAQSNNQRWYQVEIVAFARQNPDSQEHWPTNIKLGYPLNWVELKDPDSPANATDSLTPADSAQQAAVDLLRDPFYLLPGSDKKLRNHAAALQRDPRYRILAHQAWRQFIGGEKRAPAILIKGGNAFGNHRELEGSITLSVRSTCNCAPICGSANLKSIMDRHPANGRNSHNHRANYAPKYWPLIAQSPPMTCRTLINGQT